MIIGIRRADKNDWEKRVPLIPADVMYLKEKHGIQTLIQPSKIRAYKNEEYEKAIAYFKEVAKLRPSQYNAFYNISRIFAKQENNNESLKWLKTAVENGYYSWEDLQNDRYMDGIRETSEYKEIKNAALKSSASSKSEDSA